MGRGVAGVRAIYCGKEYLRYFFKEFEQYLYDNATGTTFVQITGKVLAKMPFPLPPIPEQHRIFLAIENLFSKLDEAKEKAQTVLDGFELRKSAILHKAFTGELTERWRKENGVREESWTVKPLWEIGEIITGNTPSTKNPEYYHGDVPFIKPTELNQGRFVSKSQETLSKAGKMVSRPVRAGSTCICCIGATISKCGFLSMDSVTNQQINTIMPYHFMNDLYVFYFCSSSEFKQTVIENSSATTLPIINKNKMSKLEIPVPMEKEQEKIVLVLENLISKEHQAKEAAESVLSQIDAMKKAILARAFRGELGTNDPAEEWAGEMVLIADEKSHLRISHRGAYAKNAPAWR